MAVTCLHIPDFAAWAMSRRFFSPTGDGESSPYLAHGGGLVVCAARRVYSCTPFLRRRGLAVGDSVERARSLVPEAEFLLRAIAEARGGGGGGLGSGLSFPPPPPLGPPFPFA